MVDIHGVFDPILLELHSVVVVKADDAGRLIQAGAGFRRLFPPAALDAKSPHVAAAFIRPSFSELLKHPVNTDSAVYEGLMTIGEYHGSSRSLRGKVYRDCAGITVIAESDIDEYERLYLISIKQSEELAQVQRELTGANRRLTEISLTDPLTQVANRRRLDDFLEIEISRAMRQVSALSVIMCDIDYFKRYNDEYGHDTGDRCLIAFAGILQNQVRATDLVGRYGGEEFVVILPQTDIEEAASLAERIRGRLEHTDPENLPERITASFGVVEWRSKESAAKVLHCADVAMYEAKKGGRNQVRRLADDNRMRIE